MAANGAATPTITPTGATLGAVVTDVALNDLDDAGWAAVEEAFLAHAVLIFPRQHLRREQQAAFGARFGEFEDVGSATGVTPISNTDRDGRLRPVDDPVLGILKGNEGWHTDSSYMRVSAKASMLSAHVLPSRGGETEWADMRAAYDALDELEPGVRDRIADLAAYHSISWSQRRIGLDRPDGAFYGFHDGPDPLRPLVKMHPATGRPALFIGRHAFGIPGLDPPESEALLDRLLDFAVQPPRVLTHHWEIGDLVVWDNRCVLHRVRPWDPGEPRVMKHTRIAGDPATESSLSRVADAPTLDRLSGVGLGTVET
ncbi:TauD/TfdA family dioxygenase [soil metagenome]